MKWLWQTLGCFTVVLIGLISGIFVIRSMLKPSSCETVAVAPKKASVQTNNFYNPVFGDKPCAPRKVILKVPVIQKLENRSTQLETTNSPEIITVLTVSNTSQSFYVRRIDESASGFNVSTGNTCVAWKWSGQSQNQTLSFSLERNLQIHDTTIKRVIFIISLPAEFRQTGTILSLRRSVLKGSGNSQSGEVIPIKLKDESPNLIKLLEQKYTYPSSSIEQRWASGASISKELSDELVGFTKRVGVYIDNPIEMIQDNSDNIESYEKLSEKYSCEIPKGL